jgi:hypothetical protein
MMMMMMEMLLLLMMMMMMMAIYIIHFYMFLNHRNPSNSMLDKLPKILDVRAQKKIDPRFYSMEQESGSILSYYVADVLNLRRL